MTRTPLPIVIVGHVDHGKSTLIGRLLNDTGSLPVGKVEALREMCRRRGMPFEWSFVTDALQAERDQGITIDASQVRFRSAERSYVLVDAPGHKEFLKNMVTGAASAEAAVLVVDVVEGLSEQTRRHAHLLALLGIRHIAVALNKMDAVNYAHPAYVAVRDAETFTHATSSPVMSKGWVRTRRTTIRAWSSASRPQVASEATRKAPSSRATHCTRCPAATSSTTTRSRGSPASQPPRSSRACPPLEASRRSAAFR